MATFEEVLRIVRRLRAPDGCPWDRKQTNESLKYALVEEAYEVLEAIERQNPTQLKEELGDVILVVLLHTVIQEEQGNFTADQMLEELKNKLIERHPHVFGTRHFETQRELLENWEKSKRGGLLDSVPLSLPALLLAQKVQEKTARVGFDWDSVEGPLQKVEEEVRELREALKRGDAPSAKIGEELGDLIFALVNLARHLGFNAEDLVRQTALKFIRRFQAIERGAQQQGRDLKSMSLEEMDALWEEAKDQESTGE